MSFLFSLWWIFTLEGRVRVSGSKVSNGINECTHNMSSPNDKHSYRRILLSGKD
ncbi:Bgt-51763 [Blumeria graminis f. sp. tritici]|uniref:Bgt-51763 n=1 Tax=Blumeria graminis f. sp. tritici TaxID=62690 RepID=A0A9X9MKJ2_BLUGR|nr:Bgt-51763 [Blumeria graminis f. sp. tritici]